MSIKTGANCQDAPRLFTYSHVAFTQNIGLVHQTDMTETACLQHHLSPHKCTNLQSYIIWDVLSTEKKKFCKQINNILQRTYCPAKNNLI